MPTNFVRWFQSPIFPGDEDKTRSAMLLNVVLNTFLFALPILIIGVVLGGPTPRFERSVFILIVAWLTIFGTRLIMLAGRVATAGVVTAILIFIITTLIIYNLGTIRAPATSAYILAIVIAGLTINRHAIMWMAGLSTAAVITLVIAERNGFLPTPTLTVTITQSITLTVIFCVISILLYLAVKSIDEALARARKEIFEREFMEEKLRQSEEMYRSLFENVKVGVALISKGRVLKYNETMLRQSGYAREEIENLENVSEFYFDLNERQQAMEILASHGFLKEYPVRFKHSDGTPYDTLLWLTPTTINGELYLQAVVQDVTERKHAEQAMHESEEKYRTLFETANDAIILFERTTTKVINANQTACMLYGYTLAELLQLTVGDLSAEVQATTEAIRGGATQIPLRYHKKKDGTIFPVEITAAQFTVAGKAVQVGFVRDITERLHAEQEREKYFDELGKQNAELERFTYTVSHDLRNPLVTIKGFLGLLDKDLKENRLDRIQTDFKRISNATDKMDALLSDLLELSRIGRVVHPSEEIDLAKLIRESLETLDARIRSKQVAVVISPDLPTVYCDCLRMHEVFENLIDNAAKYMGDQREPKIEIGVRQEPNEQVVFVKDNGIGIEPRYQSRIFTLFEKLNPTIEGTGIGLALIKRIIEVHGGRIWVESAGLGKGSTFCFTIPDGRK